MPRWPDADGGGCAAAREEEGARHNGTVSRTPALEIAVQDPAGVRIAGEIGAARVELASALALGGLTPSPATLELSIETARAVGVEVHVLVRPRAGDFHYTGDEIAVIERDVRRALQAGADGVVIGALDTDGLLDVAAMSRLRDAAGGASVTLHRAIDVTPDPLATLDTALGLGLHRVLTSGGASAAIDGIDTLRALVVAAEGRIEIMAGSGVDAASAAALAATGVDALHFSAKRSVVSQGGVRMGSASDGVGGYEVTDRDAALAVCRALGL
jgi:copper homeostasis protein